MSKEGHGINLEMLKIRVFSLCSRAWGELAIPLDSSWGVRPRGGLEGEKGRLWTSKFVPEELQEEPKRVGNLDVRSYHRLLCPRRNLMKFLQI